MIGAQTDAGVIEAAEHIQLGEWTSVALTEACLERIASLEPAVQAWAHVDATAALAEAADRDADVRNSRPLGPLHGVPVGIKDIIDVAGMPTTAGAAAFAHTFPTTDATLVARLRSAGAVILGKTQATQFAYRDPAPTRNPWSLEHTPGGSSSGSAAAVAARMIPAAIGTQTVGSILRPAAYCGVVGLKGSYGAVPLDGVVPLSEWLDHAGPMARSVADIALLERVLAGDGRDVLAVPARRLGVVRAALDRAEPETQRHIEGVLEQLHDAGADVGRRRAAGRLRRAARCGSRAAGGRRGRVPRRDVRRARRRVRTDDPGGRARGPRTDARRDRRRGPGPGRGSCRPTRR